MKSCMKKSEQQILDAWREEAERLHDAHEFSEDGILYRGKIFFEDNAWHRETGDEETLWLKAERNLLIITKELNDTEAWDIREETGRPNVIDFSYQKGVPFIKNLRMWSYGILHSTPNYYPDFEEARNMELSGPFFEKAPIAHVNCKKQCGGAAISQKTLSEYINRYSRFLKEQIALYDADVILCCGNANGQNLILNFVKSQYLEDLCPVDGTDGWIYYSPSTRKIVIDSYHPSARIGYEETYYAMMSGFMLTLKNMENA